MTRAQRDSTSGTKPASKTPGRSWTVRALRARCRNLRDALATSVDAETLAAYWPGGAENQDAGRGALIECYAQYVRLAGVVDQRTEQPAQTSEQTARLRAAIAQAAADEPVFVLCSDGVRRGVHPKGHVALEELRRLDGAVRALLLLDAAAEARGALPDPAAGMPRSYAVTVWAWIITHPGAGLPYDPWASEAPEPPDELARLAPQDLYALAAAHRAVHAEREAVMSAAFPTSRVAIESRLDLLGFQVTYASSKHEDPLAVLERWSRPRVIAAAVSEAIAAEEARERAALEAKHKHPGRD